MNPLGFFVPGVCIAQGSKRHVGNGRMIESSKHLKSWRQDVTLIAKAAKAKQEYGTLAGPVYIECVFVFKRPQKGHAGEVYKTSRPDSEKLERAVYDSLTDAKVWLDDSQVAHHSCLKVWTNGSNWREPGVQVRLYELEQ